MSLFLPKQSERVTIAKAVEYTIVTLVFGLAVWGVLNQL
jgi:hypothetical protein